MEFILNREELAKTLLNISHQILTKPALPVLANILIEAEKGNIKISATNLELGTVFELSAKVDKVGKITLPARVLTEFVSTLNQPEITFRLINSEMEIKAGGSSAKIPTIPADEYPAIPKITKSLVEIEGEKLSQALERVIFAASQDSGRPILTGVLIDLGGKEIKFVATDGYRLSFESISTGTNLESTSVIIPARTLTQLARVVSEEHTTTKILFDDAVNQIGFEVGKTYLVSRLIDGAFPDWQKIIPQSFKTKATLSKAEFLSAVKVAAVFAKEAGNTIRLRFSKNLEITTQSGVGTALTTVPAKVEGDELEIAFNWRYLAELLQAIPGDTIEINLAESLAPAKFTPTKGNLNFFHIIMPVRVS